MKINQVEELVEITKKNIRFYEEQGLLSPKRNPENGYRDYSLKDVDDLMKIKLLRKLSVPMEEIRLLQQGTLSFAQCMESQIVRFHHEQQNLQLSLQLCDRLAEEVKDFESLDASEYLSSMKKMEEGGTKFMDIEKNDIKQKKYGSALSAAVMIMIMILLIAMILWANTVDQLPIGVLFFMILPFVAVIIGAIVALKLRMKEIDGGEEDEARKY